MSVNDDKEIVEEATNVLGLASAFWTNWITVQTNHTHDIDRYIAQQGFISN